MWPRILKKHSTVSSTKPMRIWRLLLFVVFFKHCDHFLEAKADVSIGDDGNILFHCFHPLPLAGVNPLPE